MDTNACKSRTIVCRDMFSKETCDGARVSLNQAKWARQPDGNRVTD